MVLRFSLFAHGCQELNDVDHRLGAAETPAASLRDFFEEELLGLIPDLTKRVDTPKRPSSSLVKC